MRKFNKKDVIYESYAKQFAKFDVLTAQEAVELGKKIKFGCKSSRDKLILSNLRLVVSVAQKYYGIMPIMDLVQEGNLALIFCVDNFDYTKGSKFSTYAALSINGSILNKIYDNHSLLKVDRRILILLNKVRKETLKLTGIMSRDQAEKEVLKKLGLKKPLIQNLKVLESDSWGFDLNEKIETNEISLLERSEKDSLRNGISSIFRSLSEKERFVVRLNFGIGLEKSYTFQQIGRIKGVTKQRIYQIYCHAIDKLKNNKSLQELRIFTN